MATGIMDLETYIRPYEPPTAIQRLTYIAANSQQLKTEALRLAAERLKRTTNTKLYAEVTRELATLEEGKVYDPVWAEATDQHAAQLQEIFEHDLHQAKVTQIKDNIRQAHDQLCCFFTERGDYAAALKHVPREECTEPHHIVETCLTSIHLYALLEKFQDIHTSANKGMHIVARTDGQSAQLHAAKGLFFMRAARYKEAAQAFFCVKPDDFADGKLMTVSDVVTYAVICALVALPRAEVQQKLADFADGLDLVPAVRDLARDMCEGKYAACLKALETAQPALLLDVYLGPLVENLCLEIRRRCMIQFLAPFLSIYLRDMATVFQTDEATLQEELAALIADGKIEAKIDSSARVLYKSKTNLRLQTYEKALTLGKELEHSTRALLLRMNLVKHDLVVRDERPDREERRGNRGGGGGDYL